MLQAPIVVNVLPYRRIGPQCITRTGAIRSLPSSDPLP